MSISIPLRTVFHVKDGLAEMMATEAVRAIRDFPQEWKATPWADVKKAATATNKNEGLK